MTLVLTGQCRNRHPILKNRCTRKSGHRGPCKLDLGPGVLGVRTEEWLRHQNPITENFWRMALARGLSDLEKETLKHQVKQWHLDRCNDPNTHTEIR